MKCGYPAASGAWSNCEYYRTRAESSVTRVTTIWKPVYRGPKTVPERRREWKGLRTGVIAVWHCCLTRKRAKTRDSWVAKTAMLQRLAQTPGCTENDCSGWQSNCTTTTVGKAF